MDSSSFASNLSMAVGSTAYVYPASSGGVGLYLLLGQVLFLIVPHSDDAATARSYTLIHLLERSQNIVIRQQVRDGVVTRNYDIVLGIVMIKRLTHVGNGVIDLEIAIASFASCPIDLSSRQI